MKPDPSSEVTVPAAADLDATIRVDVRATLPSGIEQPGDMIGRYRLIEPLGQGGFGSVWRAEQHEPIHREVALKVIKPGMDSCEIIARFEAERQALALMDHPNIAAVLDAGTTESGRPFFAMELVKGVPITDYCDAKRLGIRQRLELFIPVCQAVQHAHQKSILHRDLKPSNILVMEVDGKAVPKVIDFGIAKALRATNEAVLHTSLAQTIEGIIVGTPQYMSPEQAGSVPDVDTRSDIYTLGVILYELLAGETPLGREQMKQAAMDEVFRSIRESEPRRPSSKFTPATELTNKTANLRHSEPKKLGEALKGDLDWIVMRTLEKDRNRRYETANALALELGRHLNNEPVLAGPPSVSYRLRKFVRRQKGPLSAAAALFVALAGGVVVSLWQAKVAREAEQVAEQRREAAERAQALADQATRTAEERAEMIRRNLYVSEMNAAGNLALGESGAAQILALTKQWISQPGEADLRGWEWYYLKSQVHLDAKTLKTPHRSVEALAFHPDGNVLATAGYDRAIRLWDTKSYREIQSLTGHEHHVTSLAWNPDGKRLASASIDKSIRIWNAIEGVELLRITGEFAECKHLSWSPDGKFLARGAEPYRAAIWDGRTGSRIKTFEGSRKSDRMSLIWGPRGNHLAQVQPGVETLIIKAHGDGEPLQV
ncbi:MAG TPA: hypothetical protein DDZ88_01270, partial [Verrucomicrobiales bacterium]|nr:hypothetical protein [Verrucomicrobiales bacterium]